MAINFAEVLEQWIAGRRLIRAGFINGDQEVISAGEAKINQKVLPGLGSAAIALTFGELMDSLPMKSGLEFSNDQ